MLQVAVVGIGLVLEEFLAADGTPGVPRLESPPGMPVLAEPEEFSGTREGAV
jgi:hypothetical protein